MAKRGAEGAWGVARAYIESVKLIFAGTFVGLVFILASAPCSAQGAAVSGGIGVPIYVPHLAPYRTSFPPPFLYGTQATGQEAQALTLDRRRRASFWGALDWFPGPHAGLLVRASFLRSPLDGANTPFQVTVDYLARQPPDYVERQYHYERSTAWPDTTGHMDRWSFDVEASLAAGGGSAVRAHIDGGLTFIGTSASFEPVGLTSFQLGGHSVLFTNEYRLALGAARAWSVSGVISGGLGIPIGPHASVDISGRAVLPRSITANIAVTSVGGDTALAELSTDDAQRMLAPAPMEVKLGAFELLVGVRVML